MHVVSTCNCPTRFFHQLGCSELTENLRILSAVFAILTAVVTVLWITGGSRVNPLNGLGLTLVLGGYWLLSRRTPARP